jgi:hypothetical protein
MKAGPLAASGFFGAYFFSAFGASWAWVWAVCLTYCLTYSVFSGFAADFYPWASGSISKKGFPTSKLSP